MVNYFSVVISITIQMFIAFKQILEVLLGPINVGLTQFSMVRPEIMILLQWQQNEELGFSKVQVSKREKVYSMETSQPP